MGTGRLTRDPDMHRSNDTTIARFTIAVDRRYQKQGEERKADFIPCFAFGKTAEFMEKYFTKGMKAEVEGSIETGSYTNRDGQKVYTTEVHVDNVGFAESKSSNQSSAAPPQNQAPPPQAPAYQQPPQQAPPQQPQYQQPVYQQAQNYQQPPVQYQQAPQQAPQQMPQGAYTQHQPQAYQQTPDFMSIPNGVGDELDFL